MHLTAIDWFIVAFLLVLCFSPALFFSKRSGTSTSEFFSSGHSAPWWLAGISMVATTFSSDTPNLVTDIVRRNGVAGNWIWWSFALTSMATVFFYARLWRRLNAMTDLEFYELRYSGKAASIVRGFRAVYLGLLFNSIIIATVNLAACKIAGILFGLTRWETLGVIGLLNVFFAARFGLWGVLAIDVVQFLTKLIAVIAAAYFAINLPQVGSLSGLVDKLNSTPGPGGVNYLAMLPDFANNWDIAVTVLIIPIAVQWWAVWYPGSEPGGGSYIGQRILASKSEKHAFGAVLFFTVAHYVIRPWPWIVTALASLIVFPHLSDIQAAFPNLDPSLLGHDIAYPAMLTFLPAGFAGLMIGGLIAANSSTVLTHLNWGASYLVHDFYRRFVAKNEAEEHYVFCGRLATVGIFVASSALVFFLDSAKETFDLILQVGAGTGLLYLVRWFWWRVNAWSEVAAMTSSFAVSVGLLILSKSGVHIATHEALLVTVVLTTMCWMATAFLAPETDRKVLIDFYIRVRPQGPGWNKIRREAGQLDAVGQGSITMALIGWVSGVCMIWSALFVIGNILYGRLENVIALGIILVASAAVLSRAVRQSWRTS